MCAESFLENPQKHIPVVSELGSVLWWRLSLFRFCCNVCGVDIMSHTHTHGLAVRDSENALPVLCTKILKYRIAGVVRALSGRQDRCLNQATGNGFASVGNVHRNINFPPLS